MSYGAVDLKISLLASPAVTTVERLQHAGRVICHESLML